jgi:PAS domain S-box-containing protein
MTQAPKSRSSRSRLREIEEALRQSEELHRIILTNISDSVFLTDSEGKFTFICPNVDNIFGYSFDEIYAMRDITVLVGEDLFDPERLDKVTEIRNIERAVRDKGGVMHIVLINVKKVAIKYGSRLFTCRDVTEYKRVERELSESIEHRKKVQKDLALFFNLSADLFSIMDRDLLRKVNPAWTACLGYSTEELIGESIERLVHRDDLEVTLSLERRMKAGNVVQYENRYRHKDGSYRWVSWNSIMSDEGHVHSVGRDITTKKREEDEIKRRLMRFRMEPGRAYLVPERTPVSILEAFDELLGVRYPGLVLSRRGKEVFSIAPGREFTYRWLSERQGPGTVRPDLDAIERLVEGLDGEHAVVIDGLEYLCSKAGFERVHAFVEHVREISFFKNHIVLLGVDQASLSRKQVARLEKETPKMERYPVEVLPEDSVEVLRAVSEQNSNGVRPTRTGLCRLLGLSQPTIRKRLSDLFAGGYIWQTRRGRTMAVEITDKGRRALGL